MISAAINRAWIASELLEMVEAEQALFTGAKSRAEAPPSPALAVLYTEIAKQDKQHATVLQTIAVRYGETPSRSAAGGVVQTLGRLRERVANIGADAIDVLRQDLSAKADALYVHAAWAHTLKAIGDEESARDLSAVVAEDQAHLDALLEGLKRLIEERAVASHAGEG
jgi:hypothetical protein